MVNYKMRKPRAKRTKAKARAKMPLTKTIRQEIKKIEISNAEHKKQSYSVNSLPIKVYDPGPSFLTTIDLTNVLYNITQGTGEGNRIGNRIKVSSLTARISLNVGTTSLLNNAYFRVLILRKKIGVDTTNGTYSTLFQNGNSAQAPTGTTIDMMRPINTDYFTVYHSRMVLMGSSDAVTSANPGNNTSIAKMMTFKLPNPTVVYNDGIIFPSNVGYYMTFVPCLANGFAITAGAVAPYFVSADVNVTYTDL